MSDPANLRVSDAEREQLIEELRQHTVAGRLTAEEFEERLGQAYAALTRAQIDELKQDLPLSSVAVQRRLTARRARVRRRLIQEAGGGVTASLVCVAIWIASGAQGSFWPIWVIVFTLLPLLRDGWRLLGSDPDVESVEAQIQARNEHRLEREQRRSRHRRLPR